MNWVVVDGWMKLRKNTRKEWRETYIEVDCYWILVALFPLVHFKTKWIYRFNLFIIILLNNNNSNRKVMIFDCFTTVFIMFNDMKYVVSSHSIIACFLIALLLTTFSHISIFFHCFCWQQYNHPILTLSICFSFLYRLNWISHKMFT